MLSHYPELAQDQVISRPRSPERLKTTVHERAQRLKTGTPSRKETLKGILHGLFERARSPKEFETLIADAGLTLYTRGQSVGVIARDPDGTER